MADTDVTIVVKSMDRSDPNKVRAKWKATGAAITRDSGQQGQQAGAQWGEGFKVGADGKLRDSKGRFVPGGGKGGGGMGGDGRRAGISWGGGFGDGASSVLSKIAGSYTSVFALSAKSAATAFSAQFTGSVIAGLASGAVKIAHGAAAMVALLPAAAVAGVAAMASLKLAVAGVGDALGAAMTGDAKEFNETLKSLSPAARGFAREVRGMRGELKGLQQGVQQSFFAQFAGDAKRLGGTYLPMMKSALAGIAGSFGRAAHESAGFLNSSKTSGVLAMTLGHVRAAVANVAGALPSMVRAFVPLVAVGSTFLPKLTEGLRHAASSLADMSEAGQRSGGMADFIQGGIDKLKSLWETAKQVGRIVGNVFDIFREFGGMGDIFGALGIQTGGILDSLEEMSVKAKAFFDSASGGAAVTEIFAILRSTLSATMGTLAHLVPIVARVFAPILPQLSKFGEAIANLQLALADALEPALQVVADLLGDILPVLTSVAGFFADNATAAALLAGTLLSLYAAWKLVGIATKVADSSFSLAKAGMMGIVGAAGGLALAIKQVNDATRAKDLDEMVQKMSSVEGAVTEQSKAWVTIWQAAGRFDEVMASMIEQNPRVAQQIIDNAEAFGIGKEQADGYQAMLDEAIAAQDSLTDALTRTKDAMTALTDPVTAAMDAQRALADAKQNLADVMNDEESTAQDVAAAHQAVSDAALDLTGAQLDLGAAVQRGDTSLGLYLGTLKRQLKAHDISRADYNSLAGVATITFASMADGIRRVPTHRTTTFGTRGIGTAKQQILNFQSYLGMIPRSVTTVLNIITNNLPGMSFFGKGKASGGIVGAAAAGGPRSRLTWVGEHGPELVNLPPGTNVRSNADSMNMARAGAGAGGGGVSLIYGGDGTPLDRALFDHFRKRIQIDYGGNVQKALGR